MAEENDIINFLQKETDIKVPLGATKEEKIKIVSEYLSKIKVPEENKQPVETTIPEDVYFKTIRENASEAIDMFNEAFKIIEKENKTVKSITLSQKAVELLPCVVSRSGERILDKIPGYGTRFWTASIIIDNNMKDILLSSEEKRDSLIISETITMFNDLSEKRRIKKWQK